MYSKVMSQTRIYLYPKYSICEPMIATRYNYMQVNSDKIEGTGNRLPKNLFETTWHKNYLIKNCFHQVGWLHASTPEYHNMQFQKSEIDQWFFTDVEVAATITQANRVIRVQISINRDGTSQFKLQNIRLYQ